MQNIERDVLLEEIRHEKINSTIDTLREIEYSENPKKLKQIYMYKIMS